MGPLDKTQVQSDHEDEYAGSDDHATQADAASMPIPKYNGKPLQPFVHLSVDKELRKRMRALQELIFRVLCLFDVIFGQIS